MIMDHNKMISSEYIENLITKLEAVMVYEDNYTLCHNAADALRKLIDPNTQITEG